MREEETVLSLTGGMFSDDLAEDLFLRTLFLLEGWRTIVASVWCGWAGEGRRGELLGSMGEMDDPYIQILASQAADMRASLWTYTASGPVRGPTHTHSHTALHTFRDFPRSVVHCESVLRQPLSAGFAQWPHKLVPLPTPLSFVRHPPPPATLPPPAILIRFSVPAPRPWDIAVFRIVPITDARGTCCEQPQHPRDLNVELGPLNFSHTRSSSPLSITRP